MRSRLEACFAQWLDVEYQMAWQYEPIVLADEYGQWLPDFVVAFFTDHLPDPPGSHTGYLSDGNPLGHRACPTTNACVYVEVKPSRALALDARPQVEIAPSQGRHAAVVWPEGPWPYRDFGVAYTYKGDWVSDHEHLDTHPLSRFDW